MVKHMFPLPTTRVTVLLTEPIPTVYFSFHFADLPEFITVNIHSSSRQHQLPVWPQDHFMETPSCWMIKMKKKIMRNMSSEGKPSIGYL